MKRRLIRLILLTAISGSLVVWMYGLRWQVATAEMTPQTAHRTILLFTLLADGAGIVGWEIARSLSMRLTSITVWSSVTTAVFLWTYAFLVIAFGGEYWPIVGAANLELFREYLRLQFIMGAVPVVSAAAGVIRFVIR